MNKKVWDGKFDKDTLMEASAGVMGFKKEADGNKETGMVLAGYTSVSIKNVNDDSAYDFVDDVIDEMKKKMLKAEKKWDIKMLGYDEPTFNEHDEGEDWWAIKVFFKPNSPDVDIDALVDKINYVGVIQSVDQAEDGESYSFKFESIATEVKDSDEDLHANKISKLYRQVDEIGRFWVVTKASGESELGDVCFESSVRNMMLQSAGGLIDTDVLLITKDEAKAKAFAEEVVATQNDPNAPRRRNRYK